jgi:ribosome-associated heat shock protein Hsp15
VLVSEEVRIDKWLWAARFFKTRALAREMVAGGKVHLGGHRVKPGRIVKVGDQLSITRGEEVFEVTVNVTSNRRGPAGEARLLYSEAETSVLRRAESAKQRSLEHPGGNAPARRPDKRERRQIIGFIRGKD